MPHAKVEVVKREVKKMMEMGVIEPAASTFSSTHCSNEKEIWSGSLLRIIHQENKVTVFDAEPTLEKGDALAVFPLSAEDSFRDLKYDPNLDSHKREEVETLASKV